MKKKISSKEIKVFLFSLMVITLCAVAFIFAGYRRLVGNAGTFVSSVREGAGMALSRVYQTATNNGAPAWKLNAESVSYLNEKNQAVFEKPFLIFFLKNQGQASLKARQGTLKTDSNDLEMNGNVVMESGVYTLETRELRYRHESRVLFSDVPVKITGSDMDLSADSAYFDISGGKAVFKGNVKGSFGENISL